MRKLAVIGYNLRDTALSAVVGIAGFIGCLVVAVAFAFVIHVFYDSKMHLRQTWRLSPVWAVLLVCEAASYYVEHQLTNDNVGADLLAGVIGFVLTCVVLKLFNYLRGIEDRREEREYYSDDLDGIWIGRQSAKAPETPSIPT